ncbi:hypothetical protein BDB01DRAFT_899035 [Pilobolus umbonatus]|nr:hypothetical protein BDB01DRAFT_899035 [Pilobolus umbonatus]
MIERGSPHYLSNSRQHGIFLLHLDSHFHLSIQHLGSSSAHFHLSIQHLGLSSAYLSLVFSISTHLQHSIQHLGSSSAHLHLSIQHLDPPSTYSTHFQHIGLSIQLTFNTVDHHFNSPSAHLNTADINTPFSFNLGSTTQLHHQPRITNSPSTLQKSSQLNSTHIHQLNRISYY